MMHGKHIAVVGAGPAGLAAASYLLADGFNVTILERKSGPGGVWNTNPGNSRWPSPVYDGLTTNVPRNLMTFTDHPWDPSTPLFPTSGEVNQYLEKYAQRIRMYCNSENKLEIRYNCWVTDVRKSAELGDFGWRVRVSQYRFDQPLPEEQIAVTFAAVVIAVGNYNTAFAPDHPGQSEWHLRFPNSMIHAISYRQAQDYRDKVGVYPDSRLPHNESLISCRTCWSSAILHPGGTSLCSLLELRSRSSYLVAGTRVTLHSRCSARPRSTVRLGSCTSPPMTAPSRSKTDAALRALIMSYSAQATSTT